MIPLESDCLAAGRQMKYKDADGQSRFISIIITSITSLCEIAQVLFRCMLHILSKIN